MAGFFDVPLEILRRFTMALPTHITLDLHQAVIGLP